MEGVSQFLTWGYLILFAWPTYSPSLQKRSIRNTHTHERNSQPPTLRKISTCKEVTLRGLHCLKTMSGLILD